MRGLLLILTLLPVIAANFTTFSYGVNFTIGRQKAVMMDPSESLLYAINQVPGGMPELIVHRLNNATVAWRTQILAASSDDIVVELNIDTAGSAYGVLRLSRCMFRIDSSPTPGPQTTPICTTLNGVFDVDSRRNLILAARNGYLYTSTAPSLVPTRSVRVDLSDFADISIDQRNSQYLLASFQRVGVNDATLANLRFAQVPMNATDGSSYVGTVAEYGTPIKYFASQMFTYYYAQKTLSIVFVWSNTTSVAVRDWQENTMTIAWPSVGVVDYMYNDIGDQLLACGNRTNTTTTELFMQLLDPVTLAVKGMVTVATLNSTAVYLARCFWHASSRQYLMYGSVTGEATLWRLDDPFSSSSNYSTTNSTIPSNDASTNSIGASLFPPLLFTPSTAPLMLTSTTSTTSAAATSSISSSASVVTVPHIQSTRSALVSLSDDGTVTSTAAIVGQTPDGIGSPQQQSAATPALSDTMTVVLAASVLFLVAVLVAVSLVLLWRRTRLATSAGKTGGEEEARQDIEQSAATEMTNMTSMHTAIATVHEMSIPAFLAVKIGNDFKVEQQIAVGGGGTVNKAAAISAELIERAGSARIIAKTVHVIPLYAKEQEAQFFQELSLMYMLRDSPNIGKLVGYCEQPMTILMKYYPFGSLDNFISASSTGILPNGIIYSKKNVVSLMRDLAGGIKAMHDYGVVHSDIKPPNVLLDFKTNGKIVAVLADLGIARVVDETKALVKGFTKSSAIGLSAMYASPQQWLDLKLGTDFKFTAAIAKASDVYALGIVICDCLNRRLSFE